MKTIANNKYRAHMSCSALSHAHKKIKMYSLQITCHQSVDGK